VDFDIRFIFFVLFIVFSIFRSIAQKNQPKQGQELTAREAAARRKKAQSDIDAFLNEVGAPAKQQPTRPQQRSAENRPRRSQPQRQMRPAQDVSEPRPLGSGISEHVDSYITQHVDEYVDSQVDDFVEVDIAQSVESHLGDRRSEMPPRTETADSPESPAVRFRKLLQDPEGVRQAIMLNEVMSRPRVLRK